MGELGGDQSHGGDRARETDWRRGQGHRDAFSSGQSGGPLPTPQVCAGWEPEPLGAVVNLVSKPICEVSGEDETWAEGPPHSQHHISAT